VEVGTGKPGYRWVNAYSEATPTGFTNPLTRQHWQQIATRDDLKLVFHDSLEEAREALKECDHKWGPVEHARFTGNPHRKCQLCGMVSLDLTDEDENE
jgi:hypothetical protein